MDLEANTVELNNADCILCKLFGSLAYKVRAKPVNQNVDTSCRLVAYSGMEYVLGNFRIPEIDITIIAVMERAIGRLVDPGKDSDRHNYFIPSGAGVRFISLISPARLEQLFSVQTIHRSLYDTNFARLCIAHCGQNHRKTCSGLNRQASLFFRLIDCQSQRVITAPPGSKYVALSYVWGASASTDGIEKQSLDPHSWPKVIKDSLQVTLDIGFQYLWVDRYCINQDDLWDKRVQIDQMDQIYSNAEVTIIAAAGEGPDFGLPGVAGTLRDQQSSLNIDGYHLTATPLDIRPHVIESKWASRGWTYQEAILSRRRLIFTDQEVLWDCNGTYCEEGIRIRPDLQDGTWTQMFGDRHPRSSRSSFLSHVRAFLERELTDPHDSLNALSGIFRVFEQGDLPLYHLMGVPIYVRGRERTGSPTFKGASESANQGFLNGLTWTWFPNGNGTTWKNDTSRRERISIFPSWSWAGWTSQIRGHVAIDTVSSEEPRVWMETAEGLVHFPDDESLLKNFMLQLPRHIQFIHIEARTFTCSFHEYSWPDSLLGSSLGMQLAKNPLLCLRLDESRPDKTLERWPKPMTGILVGDTSGSSLNVAALVFKELDGYYERVTCSKIILNLWVELETGLEAYDVVNSGKEEHFKEKMEIFSKWMREETVRRTIRIG
jgi:hypothetical protein